MLVLGPRKWLRSKAIPLVTAGLTNSHTCWNEWRGYMSAEIKNGKTIIYDYVYSSTPLGQSLTTFGTYAEFYTFACLEGDIWNWTRPVVAVIRDYRRISIQVYRRVHVTYASAGAVDPRCVEWWATVYDTNLKVFYVYNGSNRCDI